MAEDGPTFSGRLSLRMPVALHRALAYTAAAERVSMNQYVCTVLASAIDWTGRPTEHTPDTKLNRGGVDPPSEEELNSILGFLGLGIDD